MFFRLGIRAKIAASVLEGARSATDRIIGVPEMLQPS